MVTENESLDTFIDTYERANGERLTREDALDAVHRVLAFVRLLSTSAPAPQVRTDQPDSADSRAGPLLEDIPAEIEGL